MSFIIRAAYAAFLLAAVFTHGISSATTDGTWRETLQARDLNGNPSDGPEAYYDTFLNITWLADVGYSSKTGYPASVAGSEGPASMSWDVAQAWVTSLNINGIAKWRLPILEDTGAPGCVWLGPNVEGADCGRNPNVNTSELAHMFFVTLGNTNLPEGGINDIANRGPFENFESYAYWFGNNDGTPNAWALGTYSSSQYYLDKSFLYYAWAVHSGDVGSPVPEPALFILVGVGVLISTKVRARGDICKA